MTVKLVGLDAALSGRHDRLQGVYTTALLDELLLQGMVVVESVEAKGVSKYLSI